ncbi:MAG: c(7)-type cytochrome triheme domain-containing protein [Thiogranum sp.]
MHRQEMKISDLRPLLAASLLILLHGCQENRQRPDQSASTPPPAAAAATGPSPGTAEQVQESPASTSAIAAAVPPQPTRPKVVTKPRFGAKSSLYDRRGPAYPLLQSAADALQRFPTDRQGNIDWVQALDQGLIAPRASVSGAGVMKRRSDEIIMRNTREMPWVMFPHKQHTEWLDCSNCHPRPFQEKAGTNQVTMDTIMRGKHCGMCHDRVAFSIFVCERCHSVSHPGSPPPWW